MKQPISLHKRSLQNMRIHLAEREKQLQRMEDGVSRLREEVQFAERQIAEAKRRGITEYDYERFCVTKKKG